MAYIHKDPYFFSREWSDYLFDSLHIAIPSRCLYLKPHSPLLRVLRYLGDGFDGPSLDIPEVLGL